MLSCTLTGFPEVSTLLQLNGKSDTCDEFEVIDLVC